MALTSMQRTVLGYASQAARFYGIDPAIFFAQLIQENNMGWTGVGSSGEIGPGQFMAGTWTGTILAHPELVQMFGAVSNPSGRSNVVANVFAAAALLSDMLAVTGGNYFNALARYNGGNSALGQQNGINNNYPQLVLGRVNAVTNEYELALEGAGGDGFDPSIYTPRAGDILQNEDGSQFTIRIDPGPSGQVGQVVGGEFGGQFVALNGTFITMSGL
ncbi:MAG: transglycosylase SLT domain-containing protein, partial [Chloroflexi bacterium]|nr:transglycosylase SLT domain-containing protein [Chloroflexota bacterium]